MDAGTRPPKPLKEPNWVPNGLARISKDKPAEGRSARVCFKLNLDIKTTLPEILGLQLYIRTNQPIITLKDSVPLTKSVAFAMHDKSTDDEIAQGISQ